MQTQKIYINGEFVNSQQERLISVISPNNHEILGRVYDCNQDDVDLAVKAAKEAFDSYQKTTLEERINYSKKFVAYLREHREEVITTIIEELGTARKFAEGSQFDFYLKELDDLFEQLEGYEFITSHKGYDLVKDPVGVVACITPWNYPLGQITKKIIPALLMGNTVILKPASVTPLTAVWVTKAIDAAGFPKGSYNFLTGKGSSIGKMLTSHPDIDMITFTGSTEVGIGVASESMKSMKRVTMELGGKSASIVLDNSKLDLALDKTLDTVCFNSGQTCSALTRLLIPETMKEEVETQLIEKIKNYKVGNPFHSDISVGPVQSTSQFEKVRKYIQLGLEEGATLLVGEVPKDLWVKPTIFTDVKNSMKIAREEIFGPVLCVITYKTVEEAIEIANDSEYGLSGAVYGENAMEVAKQLRTGNVFVNAKSKNLNVPFGGYKYSGIGRENGIDGVEEFIELKALIHPLD